MLFWASIFPVIGDKYFLKILNETEAYPEAHMKLKDNKPHFMPFLFLRRFIGQIRLKDKVSRSEKYKKFLQKA